MENVASSAQFKFNYSNGTTEAHFRMMDRIDYTLYTTMAQSMGGKFKHRLYIVYNYGWQVTVPQVCRFGIYRCEYLLYILGYTGIYFRVISADHRRIMR